MIAGLMLITAVLACKPVFAGMFGSSPEAKLMTAIKNSDAGAVEAVIKTDKPQLDAVLYTARQLDGGGGSGQNTTALYLASAGEVRNIEIAKILLNNADEGTKEKMLNMEVAGAGKPLIFKLVVDNDVEMVKLFAQQNRQQALLALQYAEIYKKSDIQREIYMLLAE